MLYFVGISPAQLPAFPLSFDSITHKIGSTRLQSLPEISKNLRSSTPVDMINYFIQVITIINKNRSAL